MAQYALISTEKGDMKAELYTEETPGTVANFVELANHNFYDGLTFHRVIPGFVIQGGCPNTREATPEQVAAGRAPGMAPFGTGNPGYSIKEEFTTNPNNSHEDGALAMARSMDPNSAGSQFYLCLGPQHNLDSAIPCSARPSRARTSSASCAPAMSSSPSSSRTPRSSFAPRRARRAVSGPVSPRPNPRPARRPPNV